MLRQVVVCCVCGSHLAVDEKSMTKTDARQLSKGLPLQQAYNFKILAIAFVFVSELNVLLHNREWCRADGKSGPRGGKSQAPQTAHKITTTTKYKSSRHAQE